MGVVRTGGAAAVAAGWPRRCPVLALVAACGVLILMTATVVEGFLMPPASQPRQQWRPAPAASEKAQAAPQLWRPAAGARRVSSERVTCWSAAGTGGASSSGSSGSASSTSGNDSPTRLDAATLEPPPTTAKGGKVAPAVRIPPPHEDDKPDVKLGVLLLQLGGPERTEDVEGFLYNLFADPGSCGLVGLYVCVGMSCLIESANRSTKLIDTWYLN